MCGRKCLRASLCTGPGSTGVQDGDGHMVTQEEGQDREVGLRDPGWRGSPQEDTGQEGEGMAEVGNVAGHMQPAGDSEHCLGRRTTSQKGYSCTNCNKEVGGRK